MATTPTLSFEAIDDLIYSARIGDLDALKTDITALSKEHNISTSAIINAAIDTEDESEGGTGACLLHWPAANGNLDILTYLLTELQPQEQQQQQQQQQQEQQEGQESPPTPPPSKLLNHRNNSKNTPLHWAALNTHLECVKALVNAGADISAKNDAGHDAVFLAERTGWGATEVGVGDGDGDGEEVEEAEGKEGDDDDDAQGSGGKGREVVEWLLGCKAGEKLETGAGAGDGEETNAVTDVKEEDEMEGVVETGKEGERS